MTTETGQPLAWTPPHGMTKRVQDDWRAFYLHIRTKYGLSPRDYRDLYRAQHGVCAVCQVAKGKNPDDPQGRGGRRLGVDHNHALGNRREAVRGLLCTGGDRTCNRIIGWLNVHQLRRAVQHMERPPAPLVFASVAGMNWWEDNNGGRQFPERDEALAVVLGLKTKGGQ
jgi:hypothetical protein